MTEIPKCKHPTCNNDVYKKYDGKWAQHCSKSCQMSDISVRGLDKRKETCLEKYGVENAQQSEQIRQKTRNTCLEKYGVEIPFQAEQFQKQIKITLLERYGVDNPMKSDEIRSRATDTIIEKYGVDNVSKSDQIQKQKSETWVQNYGVDNPSKSSIIRDKVRKSHEDQGMWIPSDLLTEKESYYRIVDNLTNVMYKKYADLINPNNLKRGRFTYHLDHKYSRFDGFLNGIPPEIIGHWTNLELIPHKKNLQKHRNSSITKEKLYELYYSYNSDP